MDRIEALTAFVEVAKHKNFASAARHLGVSAPAVTRAIATLERHYNVGLFRRSTRRVTLTGEGEILFDKAQDILRKVQETELFLADARVAPQGKLVITAPDAFGHLHILPIITDLLENYPSLSAQLIFSSRMADIIGEGIDVAIRFGELEDSTLTCAKVTDLRTIVVASPAYLRRKGWPREFSELADHDLIALKCAETPNLWKVGSGATQFAGKEAKLEVNTLPALVDAACRGIGIARVVDGAVLDHLREGTLVELLPDYVSAPVPVNIVYPKANTNKPSLRMFIDALRARKSELGGCGAGRLRQVA